MSRVAADDGDAVEVEPAAVERRRRALTEADGRGSPTGDAGVDEADDRPRSSTESRSSGRDASPLPGDWYVVHSYAGYENRVKTNLETRIASAEHGGLHLPGRGADRRTTPRSRTASARRASAKFPGYVLVRMDLTDESWRVVTQHPGRHRLRRPRPPPDPALDLDEVVKILAPTAGRGRSGAASRRRGHRSTSRSASRSPSSTARSRRCPPPSPRSTPTPRSSRCWCRSSAGRLRSSSTFNQVRRSDPSADHSPNRGIEHMPPKKKLAGLIKLQIQAGPPTRRRRSVPRSASTASTSWSSARRTTRRPSRSAARSSRSRSPSTRTARSTSSPRPRRPRG